jgi:excisionase family DNA binding protein
LSRNGNALPRGGDQGTPPFSIQLPPAFVDALISEATDRVMAELRDQSHGGWLRGIEAAARYLDCSPTRVQEFVRRDLIPHERDGRWLMFHRADLDRWVRRGGAKRLAK